MPGMADMINPQGAPQVNFQQASGFQQALTPSAAPQEGPPTTPQELEQRKSGWQEFITKLRDDPAMRQAAILTATQMMRGPAQGETMAGGLGRALQVGTLAHGFLQGNQTQQGIEQTKLAEEQKKNAAVIGHTTAQTDGLRQQQEFAQQGQPGAMRLQQQKVGEGDFAEQNRQLMLEETLKGNASDRQYKQDLGTYRKALGNKATASTGPKTPAGVALFERHKEAIRASNPMTEGEDPLDYEGRIEGMALDYNSKKTGNGGEGVRANALKTLMENTDERSPEYAVYQKQLAAIGAGIPKGGSGETASADKDVWMKTRNSVPVGSKYTGPDGKTYTRKD